MVAPMPALLEFMAGLLVVLLVAAVFFAGVKLVLGALAGVFRGHPGTDSGDAPWAVPQRNVRGGRPCGNEQCHHVNPPTARYCARCGRGLLEH